MEYEEDTPQSPVSGIFFFALCQDSGSIDVDPFDCQCAKAWEASSTFCMWQQSDIACLLLWLLTLHRVLCELQHLPMVLSVSWNLSLGHVAQQLLRHIL